MGYRFFCLALLLVFCRFSFAQILPEPNARLNYTQVMFEHPPVTGADEYVVEVIYNDPGYSFANPLVKQKDSSTATIISDFEFGKKYSWRYSGLRQGKLLGWLGPYNFETLYNRAVDKRLFRVKVLQNDSTVNAGGLIILDVSGNIVNRYGDFVWFFPEDTSFASNGGMRNPLQQRNSDLTITPFGTMTAIYNQRAQERDLRGNILWQAPKQITYGSNSLNGSPNYAYNHCFKRLANGNYMVIDQEEVPRSDSAFSKRDDLPYNLVSNTGNGTVVIADEIIREFDSWGNLVWKWSAENYFDATELKKMVLSKPDPGLLHPEPGGHMNAFDVDEKNGFVYAGFRNVSRVIKIEKKSGQVVCAWGDNMSYNGRPNGQGFFLKQHGTTLLHDGSIAVFNNNLNLADTITKNPASSVIIFTQPTAKQNSRISWKFDCKFDSTGNLGGTGGNVDELKNGNLLVCMGSVNRVFEITRNKRVVWNALIENKYDLNDSIWHKYSAYRAHYASSLYPCYFTIQTNYDTLTSGRNSFQLKIFNVGTENDSYQVTISSTSGHYSKQISTSVVNPQKSLSFQINPDAIPLSNDKIQVSVTSKTNPGLKKTMYITYR